MEKTQIFEPFPMEFLTPSKKVHLGEINKIIKHKNTTRGRKVVASFKSGLW
jgi:hypothetical protein